MRSILSAAAAAAISVSVAGIARADFPVFEAQGFPMSPHQIVSVQSALIKERSPEARLTVQGMPATAHQMAVLSPRPRLTEQEIADKLSQAGFTRFQLVAPAEYTVVGMQNGKRVMLLVNSRTGEISTRIEN